MINLILEFLFIRARVMNFPYAQFLMSLILLLSVIIYIFSYFGGGIGCIRIKICLCTYF